MHWHLSHGMNNFLLVLSFARCIQCTWLETHGSGQALVPGTGGHTGEQWGSPKKPGSCLWLMPHAYKTLPMHAVHYRFPQQKKTELSWAKHGQTGDPNPAMLKQRQSDSCPLQHPRNPSPLCWSRTTLGGTDFITWKSPKPQSWTGAAW